MTATTTATSRARPGVRIGWLASTAVTWLLAIGFAWFCWSALHGGTHGIDSRAYWLAAHRADPYGAAPGTLDAYLYPPPFTLLVWPLARLPLQAFDVVWMLAEAAAFAWLLRPLGLRWGVPAFLMCFAELVVGNVHAFLALVMVFGVRRGAPWAFALLTKISTGVGLVALAAQRRWRPVCTALAVTTVVAGLAALVLPGQWALWWHFTLRHRDAGQLYFPARAALAVAVAAFAGRRRKPWLLPIALILAQPVAEWMSLTMLAAMPRLARERAAP